MNLFIQVFKAEFDRDEEKQDQGTQVYVGRGQEKKTSTKALQETLMYGDITSLPGNLWWGEILQDLERTRRSVGKQMNKRKVLQFCRKHLRFHIEANKVPTFRA